MSTVTTESKEIAALNAKLEGTRSELTDANKELNTLRTKVAKLEDASIVEDLTEENDALKASLAAVEGTLEAVKKQLQAAQAEAAAAGPALALAAAINAVKG